MKDTRSLSSFKLRPRSATTVAYAAVIAAMGVCALAIGLQSSTPVAGYMVALGAGSAVFSLVFYLWWVKLSFEDDGLRIRNETSNRHYPMNEIGTVQVTPGWNLSVVVSLQLVDGTQVPIQAYRFLSRRKAIEAAAEIAQVLSRSREVRSELDDSHS
jgi:hypothetical protein